MNDAAAVRAKKTNSNEGVGLAVGLKRGWSWGRDGKERSHRFRKVGPSPEPAQLRESRSGDSSGPLSRKPSQKVKKGRRRYKERKLRGVDVC